MSRIIKYKEMVWTPHHRLFFPHPGHSDWGFSFDCDGDGKVDADALNPCARKNYEECMANPEYRDRKRIHSWNSKDWEPGLMKCDCGEELEMYRPGGDIHCDCGRSYNSAGQLLAPRSQWGEETGEAAMDYDIGYNNPERAFDE